MIEAIALAVAVLTGLYFIALGVVSLFMPAKSTRFLLGFAGTAFAHYTELSLRFLAGAALVVQGPHMFLSRAFTLFGWVLLVTTACLFIIPWRWHHRFAQQVVPWATRHVTLVGFVSLAIGGLMLVAVMHGSAA